MSVLLDIRPDVARALARGQPVVALESTLFAHGLPWPINLETAWAAQQVVRESGAVPATIGILAGKPTIGLSDAEIEQYASPGADILKASTRDLASAIVRGRSAATTVASTMRLAHLAGIRVFATGGIGGVHPVRNGQTFDISADLHELGQTPVAVVCSGAKSILDLAATLEYLETLGVPVVGWQTNLFPAFYLHSSERRIPTRVDSLDEAAALLSVHWQLGGKGVVLARPVSPEQSLERTALANALRQADEMAHREGVAGPELTPYLLRCLATLTGGRSLEVNRALIVDNARLAAEVALVLRG